MRLRLALPLVVLAAVLVAPGADAGFPAGQCTTWAYLMRPEIVADAALAGIKITDWNAWRWATNAREAGFGVGGQAKVGAIAVWPRNVLGAGSTGHVAYVQKVRPDGSFYVSEEDYNGSPNVHYRWVQPSSSLQFVYLLPGAHAPSGPITPGGQIEGLSSSGTFAAADLTQTSVSFTVDAATNVSLRFTGPNTDRTFGWRIPAGKWTVGLDKVAAASTLAPGAYKLTVFAYDTQIDWRWLTFNLA